MKCNIFIKNLTINNKSYGCYIITDATDSLVVSHISILESDSTKNRNSLNLLYAALKRVSKKFKIVTVISDDILMLSTFKSHDSKTRQPSKEFKYDLDRDVTSNIIKETSKYNMFVDLIIDNASEIYECVKIITNKLILSKYEKSFDVGSEEKIIDIVEKFNNLSANKSLVDLLSNSGIIKDKPIKDKPIKAQVKPKKTSSIAMNEKPMNTKNIEITDEYKKVFELIDLYEDFVFVTGNAGTGKSVLIHEITKKFYRKKVAICAPTGLAALNIGGVTIHSLFGLPSRMLDEKYVRKMSLSQCRDVVNAIEILIIDEISMVRCDIVDAINIILQRVKGNNDLFGGITVVGVGDLFQLPPVVVDSDNLILSEIGYKSEFFFSAMCIRALKYPVIELKRIYRQKDETFKTLLNKLRIGVDINGVVNKLNERYNMPTHKDGVILATTNKIVDNTNKEELSKLNTPEFLYTAEKTGIFDEDKGKSRQPAPDQLKLKLGAKVMFVSNDPEKRFVNGTLGLITALTGDGIQVESENGEEIYLKQKTWESYKYSYDKNEGELKANVDGTYTQYPLILAWAITIHKSQGKTLTKIQLDLGWGTFADGQLYVAISRITTFEGLSIKNCVKYSDVKVSPKVVYYYQRKLENV